jgi:hypothetical protein
MKQDEINKKNKELEEQKKSCKVVWIHKNPVDNIRTKKELYYRSSSDDSIILVHYLNWQLLVISSG